MSSIRACGAPPSVPELAEWVDLSIEDTLASALGTRKALWARAVVVTALGVVHEIALPKPTPARRRAAVAAVLAVARHETG